jgi:hypothetical protein
MVDIDMGGYDNTTSKSVSKAKTKSINHHYKNNQKLYEEYISSKFQYLMSFPEYKKRVKKRKRA